MDKFVIHDELKKKYGHLIVRRYHPDKGRKLKNGNISFSDFIHWIVHCLTIFTNLHTLKGFIKIVVVYNFVATVLSFFCKYGNQKVIYMNMTNNME